jgi:hydroxymethylglutaryl-CoA lyase
MRSHTVTKPAVTIVEVGPRDGLQILKSILPTAHKKRWIAAAAAAGVREIEVCSFVPAAVVPGMADAAEIVRYARTIGGLTTTALAPNAKGAQAAFAAGAHRVSMPISVSVAHNLANIRKTHEQSIDELRRAVDMRNGQPKADNAEIEVGLSTAFGCSIAGVVPEKDVLALAEKCLAAGADRVTPADTIGIGNPLQVKRMYAALYKAFGTSKIGGSHFHDTRGQGIANALAALEAGVTSFDTSLAGLGGCPFAPGASGNVCTEDLVWVLEEMGVSTGIDLAKLLACREILEDGLPLEKLSGHLGEAGLARTQSGGRVAAAR